MDAGHSHSEQEALQHRGFAGLKTTCGGPRAWELMGGIRTGGACIRISPQFLVWLASIPEYPSQQAQQLSALQVHGKGVRQRLGWGQPGCPHPATKPHWCPPSGDTPALRGRTATQRCPARPHRPAAAAAGRVLQGGTGAAAGSAPAPQSPPRAVLQPPGSLTAQPGAERAFLCWSHHLTASFAQLRVQIIKALFSDINAKLKHCCWVKQLLSNAVKH